MANTIEDKDKLLGIPLQCMMLAEAYKEVKKQQPDFLLDDRLSLVKLYESFWKSKCTIYHSEKWKKDETNLYADLNSSLVELVGERFFQRRALAVLFKDNCPVDVAAGN